MRTIMVLNSKGGSGKTTLVTNLAGIYASQNKVTIVKDYDPQGSSTEWHKQRPYSMPEIHCLTAFKPMSNHVTRAWQMRLPRNAERLIIDSPAGIDLKHYVSVVKSADKLLVPVTQSAIDIRATEVFLKDLLTFLKLYPCGAEIGVVANRADTSLASYQSLKALVQNMGLELVTALSASNHYIMAAETGASVLELEQRDLSRDLAEWEPLMEWIDGKPSTTTHSERHLYAISK